MKNEVTQYCPDCLGLDDESSDCETCDGIGYFVTSYDPKLEALKAAIKDGIFPF